MTFIETEIKRLGKVDLDHVFDEIKLVSGPHMAYVPFEDADRQTLNIVLSDAVSAYLEPSIRQGNYSAVRPNRLALILAKTSRALGAVPTAQAQGRAEKRRREADAVAALASR